jgi:tight adherence protein B
MLVTQIPNAVDLCVRSLEAGLSITTAFSVCAEELQDPIRSEFKIIRDDMKSGLGIEEAVMRFNQRRTETAVTYFATLIALQNRSGGGLSSGLKNLSRVLRENQRLYVRLHALTTEPKTSMRVLIAIPIIFGCISTVISPENMRKFFETDLGLIYFFGLVGWALIGVFIMNAMTDIDDV